MTEQDITKCVAVIKESFITVANEFGFTAENAPRFTAFATTEDRLKWHLLGECRPMYAFYDKEDIVGYYSLLLQSNQECELNNLCVICGNNGIVLKPLTDKYLPLLYQWNSDIEVLFWGEGDDVTEPYDEATVDMIYGGVSQNAFCFLIEKGNIPVGECWLQKMNIRSISDRYPKNMDVRRIDYCIGAKEFWGKGIGTECLRMLLKFAFEVQNIDVLYIMPYDYNIRSIHLVEHAGFKLEKKNPIQNSKKEKFELLYKMTKEDFRRLLRSSPASSIY